MRAFVRACTIRPCTTPQRPRSLLPRAAAQKARRSRSDDHHPAGPEAPPFHGYLVDALDAPLHSIAPATRTAPTTPSADDPPTTPEEEKLAKARVVFGSRLAGPVERKRELAKMSVTVAGVLVPPRPEEPENCCMSGCVNCVWDVYREEIEEWATAKREVERRKDRGVEMKGRVEEEEDGGARGGDEGAGTQGDLFEGIPVGIREFMKTEKKLKLRHQRNGTVAG